MNLLTLAARGLRFHRRTLLGVLAGCAVSSAVLAGALFVGDSVRISLGGIAEARLGRVSAALDTGNRYFRSDLPARLGLPAAAALQVKAMAARDGDDGAARRQINKVDLLGVDAAFLDLGSAPAGAALKPGELALGERLARALGAKPGDEISVRMARPALLSRDAPLAGRKEGSTRRGLFTVAAVLDDASLGRFSLRSDQNAPYVAYVPLAGLQETLDLEGWANLLVSPAPAEAVKAALARCWRLEDAGLSVRALPERGLVQLESVRIYLDPAVSAPALAVREGGIGAVSYVVDALQAEGRSTPYSFVTALSPSADASLGVVPADMKDDEILVNRWLADHLKIGPGAPLTMKWSELVSGDRYVPREAAFRVRAVLEMAALAAERALVPEFPGLTDVNRCADWDIGIPMKESELNDKDNEAYWEAWRQTPKAFVTLAAGRRHWSNRFGDLMAVRYKPVEGDPGALADALKARLDPETAGLAVQDAAARARRAVAESMDLGGLFLGMSFFLIGASLLLTALLFVFSAEQRAREMGVLLASGFTPAAVRRVFLLEAAGVALAGSLAGLPLGWGFAKGMLAILSGWGSGAVAHVPVTFHATAGSALAGALGAAAVSVLAMAFTLRRQSRRVVRQLLADDFTAIVEREAAGGPGGRGARRLAVAALLGAAAVIAGALASGSDQPAPAFFAAGALLLTGGLAWLRGLLTGPSGAGLSVRELGRRNAGRRPGRALAAAGMLAAGSFMVLAVSAMTEDLSRQEGRRDSGTGGFALVGESSVAVVHDLAGEAGRAAHRLTDAAALEGVRIVQLKAREGDDASCLNLNQAVAPSLVGVDPELMGRLEAFAPASLWALLDAPREDGTIPALVGDAATALWKLHKRAHPEKGDVLEYLDERGDVARIRLVGTLPQRLTVLQGRLLLSQKDFGRLYPGEAGTRLFLVDAPAGRAPGLQRHLAERMETVGLDLVPAVDRLREFYAVERAYLTLFAVLGALGLLLGTAGMGVLVLRNVMERRAEFAVLQAVGWTRRDAVLAVTAEHGRLVSAGLLLGAVSALLAILPAALRPGGDVPVGLLGVFLLAASVFARAWVVLAARWALRSPIVSALRSE
jgi:putative ABC transport system permease protein